MLLSGQIDYNILYIASYDSDMQKCIMTVPSPSMLMYRVKLVLNNERLQRMLADELLTEMKKSGFTVADAIAKRKEILEVAIATKQLAIANRTLDSLDAKLGISDEQLKEQPLLDGSRGMFNFDHLAKVKQINYREVKQIRDSAQNPS
jgi:hypothetical protein